MREPPQTGAGPAPRDAALARGFASLVALTLCLIVLGALVRANDAGLACPDWPLCFGEWIPAIDLRVGFEWSHRVLAGSVALIFAALSACAWRSPRRTREISALLIVASALLAAQILLGALTVWLRLAPWTVAAHLITGNSFACAALLLARAWREGDARLAAGVRARSRFWISLAGLLLLVQLGIGGLVSSHYAGMACPEWPTCNGGLWFPSWRGSVGLHVMHRLTGYALVAALGLAAFASRGEPRTRRATALAFALGALQVAVGVANVLGAIPEETTALHTGVAAAIALSLASALREAWHSQATRARSARAD